MTAYLFWYLFTGVQNGSVKHSWLYTSIQSKFPPWFWLISHYLVRCSPRFLCLWDISLKLVTRSLSWASVPAFQEQESWYSLFSWCELFHILGSCLSWKIHSCKVEFTFISSSFSPMKNFASKAYGFSKILLFFILKNVFCFKLTWYQILACGNFLQPGSSKIWSSFYMVLLY